MSRWTVSSGAGAAPTDVGYDIVLLWGQSNMVGQNTGADTAAIDTTDPRIRVVPFGGTYAGQVVLAVDPLNHPGGATGVGPGMPFARAYAASVPPNRRVLLVPSAVGGSVFEGLDSGGGTHRWKVSATDDGTNLYKNAIRAAKAAKDLAGPNSRFAAILWHQGESDGINGTAAATYQTDLDALIDAARTDLAVADLPFVVGQPLPEFWEANTGISAVLRATPTRKTRAAFASGPFAMNNGDTLHYSVLGQRVLGRNMYEALLVAKGLATPTAPAQVTGLAGVAAGTSVTLTWDGAPTATSYWVEYKATASGTWLAGPGLVGTTATVTGLSQSTAYDFRVTARNYAGSGTASATLAKSTTGPNLAAVNPVTSGLIGWYKADAGVTTAGSAVTAVTDQSTQANNLAQATSGDRPTLVASGINGAPSFSFSGTQGLISATVNGLTGQPTTLFAVFQQAASPAHACTVMLVGNGPTGGRQYRLETTGIQHVLSAGTADAAYGTTALTQATPHVGGIRMTTTAINFYADGAGNGTTTMTVPTFGNTTGMYVGYSAGFEGFIGLIGEVLIFNRALTDTEVGQVNTYLGSRFGVVVS